MDLFEHAGEKRLLGESPLANRMRPRTLEEFVGQDHIVGPGRLLRRAIQADQLSSVIFYGPPGTGKTTLARVIANSTRSQFLTINAVLAGVKEIREAIEAARERRAKFDQRTTLFVDEVHRWNKAQQDALLPHVENGTIVLVGATTENPYFEVNKALVSRSRIFQLKPLTEADLRRVVAQALADPERGYGKLEVRVDPDALEHLVGVGSGDARSVLNALELAVETTPGDDNGVLHVTLAVAEESIQRRAVLYDKEGDVHYDTISAFIKSLRGSDPDAALYWMAKMVYAGEDPRFIFRRMAILAGEDVGMADPQAAVVVASCWEIFERIGMPEGRYPLAEAALYLATCPKSNSAFAFFDALATVEKEADAEVPIHLKDASRDKEGFGHGAGYLYPHAYRDHWVAQQYLPDALQGKVFYEPGDQGHERAIRAQVARRREEQLAAMLEATPSASEILTTSPVSRSRDAWLARAVAASSRTLGRQRDRVFEAVSLARHHLVLDLNSASGLLAWEALRQTPEGGVWAHTTDQVEATSLRQSASRLPELERLRVLSGPLLEVPELLSEAGEQELKFDVVLGRGLFIPPGGEPLAKWWPALLGMVRGLLLPGGRICLLQAVPRLGQRLFALVDWSDEAPDLARSLREAEEALYSEPGTQRLAWDAHDLEAALGAAGFAEASVSLERSREERRIAAALLDRWFPPGLQLSTASEPGTRGRKRARKSPKAVPGMGAEKSYAEGLLAAGLDGARLARAEARFRRQLADKVVSWEVVTALVIAR
ncbi:MAG: AAA family ATPase [Polyangia bacterium]|jgi:putative ATPase|nr:AAA family ATPase [Polyangia bacterium]